MRIAELFRRPIQRTIEEVIKVDLGDEQIVAAEIDEYVATSHILDRLGEVLDAFQETINNPSERTNIWVSGFFGSGKSSFAKMLGYLVENPTIDGRPAVDRFKERVDAPRIEALLNTARAQAPALTVFLDLSTGRNVAREGESVVLPVYRALLDRLGYSRNLLLAELEFDLEGDGDLATFEELFQQVAKDGKAWTERRNVGLARNEASHALHLLRPETYPQADSWARSAQEPEVTANWFADRALQLLERRAGDHRRIMFVVDEVGQYVARTIQRILDLHGLAEAVQKKHGRLWLVVTSQERLDDVVDSLEGRQVELARVQDRFPLRVDLLPSDIQEVTGRRVLEKTAAGQEAVRAVVTPNRHQLLANVRLDSPTRSAEPSEDEILRLYPLVPYQIQLLIDAVSARRAHGGASPILGGSNRTIIKLAHQLIVDPRAGLADESVGVLVTLDRAYDLLDNVIPTAWQSEVEQVAAKYGTDSLEAKAMKAVALCSDVGALPLTAENLAVLLHPGVADEAILLELRTACEHLVGDDRLRFGDDGYQLQSAEQKDWEKARRQIDARGADITRICRLALKEELSGLAVHRGRAFKVEVTVEGEKLTEGDVALHIEEADDNRRTELRALSREVAAKARVTWVYAQSEDTYEAIVELHRSRSMIGRKDTPAKSAAEVELLGQERVRQARLERLVVERLGRDLADGHLIFRGVVEEAPAGAIRAAAQRAISDRIPEIYERIDQFSASLGTRDVIAVLRADNLDGIHKDLREEGIGLTETTPRGERIVNDRDPLLAVLNEIRHKAVYGNEATGRTIEALFTAPPYGAPIEVIQAILAAGIRCGDVEVIHQGARIRDHGDHRLDRVFGALPQFRAASFVPASGPGDGDPPFEVRAELAQRLGELTGSEPPAITDQLARALRHAFAADIPLCGRIVGVLRGAALKVPEPVTALVGLLDRIVNAPDGEAITTAHGAWTDLSAGRELLAALDPILEQDLETLREAQRQVAEGDEGLTAELATERSELADLLSDGDLPRNVARIRSITTRLADHRTSAARDAAARLAVLLADLRQRVRARHAELDSAVVDEALRPLDALMPTDDVSPADIARLKAGLEAADGRAAAAERQLDEIAAKGRVAHVRVAALVVSAITTEEELDAALERIREAASAHLTEGLEVRFS